MILPNAAARFTELESDKIRAQCVNSTFYNLVKSLQFSQNL